MRLGRYLASLTRPELEELKDVLNLTDDENMVFEQLSKGRSKIVIADNCRISERTVGYRVQAISKKVERLNAYGKFE